MSPNDTLEIEEAEVAWKYFLTIFEIAYVCAIISEQFDWSAKDVIYIASILNVWSI